MTEEAASMLCDRCGQIVGTGHNRPECDAFYNASFQSAAVRVGKRAAMGGRAGLSFTPLRRRMILELAQADGQPWTDDQTTSGWTDHMGEVMYGRQADAVDCMLKQMRTLAHEAGWDAGMAFVGAARLADAWDEGYLRGTLDNVADLEPADNPYRAEVSP